MLCITAYKSIVIKLIYRRVGEKSATTPTSRNLPVLRLGGVVQSSYYCSSYLWCCDFVRPDRFGCENSEKREQELVTSQIRVGCCCKPLKCMSDVKLIFRPAMYVVPAHHKDDKWSSTPYKPCTVKLPYYQPQTHPNAFRLVREDRPQFNIQQFQMPLLGTSSETGSRVVTPVPPVGVSKNDTNAKINLLQCESNSSKSIILELGKSTPDYSLGVNLNSEDKFCKDDEKTFLS